MRLIDLGTTPAVLCRPDTPIQQVARQMAEHEIGSVVVVSDDRRVVGIVTDRDLVVRAVAAGRGVETRVDLVMSHDVVSAADSASPLDAARQMAVRECRRLPVIDEAGHVLGVVSADDLVRSDAAVLDQLALVLTHERRHGVSAG